MSQNAKGKERERHGGWGDNGGERKEDGEKWGALRELEREEQKEQTDQKQNTHIPGNIRQIGSYQGSNPSSVH